MRTFAAAFAAIIVMSIVRAAEPAPATTAVVPDLPPLYQMAAVSYVGKRYATIIIFGKANPDRQDCLHAAAAQILRMKADGKIPEGASLVGACIPVHVYDVRDITDPFQPPAANPESGTL